MTSVRPLSFSMLRVYQGPGLQPKQNRLWVLLFARSMCRADLVTGVAPLIMARMPLMHDVSATLVGYNLGGGVMCEV